MEVRREERRGGGIPAVVADTAHGNLMAIVPETGVSTDDTRSGRHCVWKLTNLRASIFS